MKWILFWAMFMPGDGYITGNEEFKTETACQTASYMLQNTLSIKDKSTHIMTRCERSGLEFKNNTLYNLWGIE